MAVTIITNQNNDGTQYESKTTLPVAVLQTPVLWVRFTVRESSDLGLEGFLRNGENKVSSGSREVKKKSTSCQNDQKQNYIKEALIQAGDLLQQPYWLFYTL